MIGTGKKVKGSIYLGNERKVGGEKVISTLLLLILLAFGFFLRAKYMLEASLYVDEYTTIFAAQKIIAHGYPRFPSGVIYSRGLLFSYLDALPIYLLGFSSVSARLPSVVASTLTILLIFFLGRRLFSRNVGLIVAALLALSPEVIIWGGRARMYSLLLLFIVLSALFFFEGVISKDDERKRRLFLCAFLLALFSHEEALILLPAFLLAALLRRGVRFFTRRGVILDLILGAAVIVGRLVLFSMQSLPGQVVRSDRVRPFIQPSFDLADTLKAVAPFFVQADRLPATLLLLSGLFYVAWRTWQRLSAPKEERVEDTTLSYLYLLFGVVVLEILFIVGESWRHPRYLFLTLPLFFLIAGASFDALSGVVMRARQRERLALTYIAVIILSFLLSPLSMEAAFSQEIGYDKAFLYVQENREEGDLIMTPLPIASIIHLGRCDFLPMERGFEGYVWDREGKLIDGWLEIPLLTSAEESREILRTNRKVWFVVDEARLQMRYTVEFVTLLLEQMELVYKKRGAMVFLSTGYKEPLALQVEGVKEANFDGQIVLQGYGLSADEVRGGERLKVRLLWRATEPESYYFLSLRLVGSDGQNLAQTGERPLGGLYHPKLWPVGQVVPDEHHLAIPTDASPGLYRLEMLLYHPVTLDPLPLLGESLTPIGDTLVLDYITVAGKGEAPLEPTQPLEANLGGEIRLLGYDLPRSEVSPGEAFPLTLYWRGGRVIEEDYTIFIHLVGADGQIGGQEDSQPLHGFYPTSQWDVGDMVVDEHSVSVKPDAPPGEYQLLVGMYLLSTMERLPVLDDDGRVVEDYLFLDTIRLFEEER